MFNNFVNFKYIIRKYFYYKIKNNLNNLIKYYIS